MSKYESQEAFYKTTRWKRLREKVLRRDNYMCQLDKRYGKMHEAQTVHHIFPRDKWPEYQWKEWNLISLTSMNHNKMHVRNGKELTEEGKQLLRRICTERGMEIPEEYR